MTGENISYLGPKPIKFPEDVPEYFSVMYDWIFRDARKRLFEANRKIFPDIKTKDFLYFIMRLAYISRQAPDTYGYNFHILHAYPETCKNIASKIAHNKNKLLLENVSFDKNRSVILDSPEPIDFVILLGSKNNQLLEEDGYYWIEGRLETTIVKTNRRWRTMIIQAVD